MTKELKTGGVKVHVTKPQDDPLDETVETGPDASQEEAQEEPPVDLQESAGKGSTDDPSSDTVAELAAPVRIREERAVGGRFVSLGGGEREWVPEEGQLASDVHPAVIDDEAYAEAQKT